jgi:hypothetical protein
MILLQPSINSQTHVILRRIPSNPINFKMKPEPEL